MNSSCHSSMVLIDNTLPAVNHGCISLGDGDEVVSVSISRFPTSRISSSIDCTLFPGSNRRIHVLSPMPYDMPQFGMFCSAQQIRHIERQSEGYRGAGVIRREGDQSQHKSDSCVMDDKTNIFIASFTTCWARLKLYDLFVSDSTVAAGDGDAHLPLKKRRRFLDFTAPEIRFFF